MSHPTNTAPDCNAAQHWLAASGLPALWAHQPQWRVLQAGFGTGSHFFTTWQAWRDDASRPHLLHFVATMAQPIGASDAQLHANTWPQLVEELTAQCWGLLPGVHRLRFDDGRVLLTLLIGDAQAMLRQQDMVADSIYLDDIHSDLRNLYLIKALSRCARRGTRLVTGSADTALRKDITQCGFQLAAQPEHAPLQATFNPAWQPRHTALSPAAQVVAALPQRSAVVIGAGIAGAACAQQLALRGWQVTVLDAAAHPAAGASALPAGIFAPHTSSDDSLLSRITRAGMRTTVQWAQALLRDGEDWQMTGVLERRQLATPYDETAGHSDDRDLTTPASTARPSAHQRPASWGDTSLHEAAAAWSQAASGDQLALQSLPAGDGALWHSHSGWLRPAALVAALLQHPKIRFVGNARVQQLQPLLGTTRWAVVGEGGSTLAEADLVVVCAGPQSAALAPNLPLQPIRGQVSWGVYADGAAPVAPCPVNGHGSWVPYFKTAGSGQTAWVMGSSFERDVSSLPPSTTDTARAHADNWAKLQALLPSVSQNYAGAFLRAKTWAQVRCASNDRLPLVGPLQVPCATDQHIAPQICTAMGSRGLTWALLCAELLAARLHGEPLPLANNLAKALDAGRY
ncbi:MAG: FAD-dependent 5-carboxymethylaminomethyl-2-thiouridine(34) oxidoreductase MnmC [Comamonas sp.]